MGKRLGKILKIPLVAMVVISFAVSFYAASQNLFEVGYGSVFFLGVILVLYFVGMWMTKEQIAPSEEY